MADGGDRTGLRCGQRHEIAVDRLHLIAVAHPDDGFGRHAGEQAVGVVDAADGPAELAAGGRLHLAAEQVTGQLHAVADAEHGDAEVEELRVAARAPGA